MSPARRPDTAPAVKPIDVSPDLKALTRRLKLGQLLDPLPERLALARAHRLPHHDFLEMLLADEVTRRDRKSAQLRAKAAHLDPQMQLQGLGRHHSGHLRPTTLGRTHLAAIPR
jgi:hypothetical protein